MGGQSWRPWFFREEPAPLDLLRVKAPEWGQTLSAAPRRGDLAVLGGYIENWVSNGTLTFATVRGVGHMVPQFRPQAGLHLFARTMKAAIERKGQPPQLTPLLPKGMLLDATHQEFYGTEGKAGLLGLWLEDASKMAYGVVEPHPRGIWAPSMAAAPASPVPFLLSVMPLAAASVAIAYCASKV